jgi:Uma2 family endonuclease
MEVREVAVGVTAPGTLRMSYEEFLAWAGEDTRAEWANGEVIILMPPLDIHQTIAGFLYTLLNLFVQLFGLGKVQVAPFEVKLSPEGSAREPDILFVATENLGRLTPQRLHGPADLIVEIISDDSVRRDRQIKFKEYEEVGVREYWVIDPRAGKQRADFYALNETGEFELFATEDEARVESRVLPGFWLRPAWLWEVERLNPLLIFYEMRGLSPSRIQEIQQELRGDVAANEAGEGGAEKG